jgi:hypothetical protein
MAVAKSCSNWQAAGAALQFPLPIRQSAAVAVRVSPVSNYLKWMVGFNLAVSVAVLIKLLV